jgi:hypothetical protein
LASGQRLVVERDSLRLSRSGALLLDLPGGG